MFFWIIGNTEVVVCIVIHNVSDKIKFNIDHSLAILNRCAVLFVLFLLTNVPGISHVDKVENAETVKYFFLSCK